MDHTQSPWQTPPPQAQITADQIHVWLVSADEPDQDADSLLSPRELDRASRLQRPDARVQYLASQCALRRLLGRYLALEPQSIELARTKAGKPHLAAHHNSSLRFNISHSGTWAMIAFALGKEIGVDLEAHRTVNAMALAERFFCVTEAQRLADCSVTTRQDRFFDMWTAKEALGKAIGSGISGTLRRFDVVTRPRMAWRDLESRLESTQWTLQPLPAPRNYSAALAVEREVGQLHLFRWT